MMIDKGDDNGNIIAIIILSLLSSSFFMNFATLSSDIPKSEYCHGSSAKQFRDNKIHVSARLERFIGQLSTAQKRIATP